MLGILIGNQAACIYMMFLSFPARSTEEAGSYNAQAGSANLSCFLALPNYTFKALSATRGSVVKSEMNYTLPYKRQGGRAVSNVKILAILER